MLLLAALVSTAAWSCGFAQEIPVQSRLSITKSKGSVRLECRFNDISGDFDSTVIHWYQQKANKAPERILYLAGTKKVDEGFQEHRYRVEKDSSEKLCILTINDVTPDDTATYYCAYWYDHCGGSAQVLQQSPVSITKPQSKTVLINCHVSDPDFNNVFIHWYRKRPNAAPRRVAYMSSRLFLENPSDEGKFSIGKDPAKSVCTLRVSKVTLQDSATYYCARWDAQQ